MDEVKKDNRGRGADGIYPANTAPGTPSSQPQCHASSLIIGVVLALTRHCATISALMLLTSEAQYY
jgi:hypothetical protein